MKRKNLNSHQVPSEPGKQEARAITPNVAHNASTFAWHKYSLYEKLLRIVAYMLRSFPKCACNWTKTASITDPAEYVPSLNRKNWPSPSDRDLKTDECVCTVEPASQRVYYPLSGVLKLNFGSDPVTSWAGVQTASGNFSVPLWNLPPFPILILKVSSQCWSFNFVMIFDSSYKNVCTISFFNIAYKSKNENHLFWCIFIFLFVDKMLCVIFADFLLKDLTHLLGPGGCCKQTIDQRNDKLDRLV